MKIAMIVCQDNPEVVWNAFRLANMMLEGMDDVSIFLNTGRLCAMSSLLPSSFR